MKMILASGDMPDNLKSLCKLNRSRIGKHPVNADGVENKHQIVIHCGKAEMVVAKKGMSHVIMTRFSLDSGVTSFTVSQAGLEALTKL
jgi:hypothetical protein